MRAVVAGCLLVLLLSGCDGQSPDDAVKHERVDKAARIAQEYATKEEATIRSATATWSSGTVATPNTSQECESGQLVNITLAGSFPHITTSGGPPGGDGTDGVVTGVFLTADAQSGNICQISVTTGEVEVGRGRDRAASAVSAPSGMSVRHWRQYGEGSMEA